LLLPAPPPSSTLFPYTTLFRSGLGVRVLRIAPDLVARAHLDQGAEIHDGHAVGDVLDHREVVADEEVGDAELALEVLQKVDHLRSEEHTSELQSRSDLVCRLLL